ncbi:Cullin-associated NEDD8-dissociated protein 1 [Dionaea muscipula]
MMALPILGLKACYTVGFRKFVWDSGIRHPRDIVGLLQENPDRGSFLSLVRKAFAAATAITFGGMTLTFGLIALKLDIHNVGAFFVLKEPVVVLPDCLPDQIGSIVPGIEKALLEQENNRPVALDEVYLNTHLKGGKFYSEKARKVYPTSGPNVEVMTLMAQLMVSQLIAQTQPTSSTPHQGAAPLTFQMQIPAEYLSVFSSHLSASVPPPPPPPLLLLLIMLLLMLNL